MLIIHATVITTREESWVNNVAYRPLLEHIMITSKSAFLYYNDLLLLHWLSVVVARSILQIFLVFLPDAP